MSAVFVAPAVAELVKRACIVCPFDIVPGEDVKEPPLIDTEGEPSPDTLTFTFPVIPLIV